MYEQLSLCVVRNATRVWVLNVGDLKPYEREIEYWMALGWNASVWNPDNVDDFVTAWAQREFKLDVSDASVVADIVANLTRYNALRKPELLTATTFSLVNYRECALRCFPSLYACLNSCTGQNVSLRNGILLPMHRQTSITSYRLICSPRSSKWSNIPFLPARQSEKCLYLQG